MKAPAMTAVALVLTLAASARAEPFMVVGLDQKLTWDDAGERVLTPSGHDLVAIVDLAQPEAPRTIATLPLENSVVGPPVNIAVSPDNRIAIVASSMTNVPKNGGGLDTVPTDKLFVIDLVGKQPQLVQTLTVGRQPSGLSINLAGTLALVTYRADNSVGVFRIERGRLSEIVRVDVRENPAHVAFTPDGHRALVVKQDANRVALLDVDGEQVTYRHDLETTKGPYNVEVTPDGRLGITSDSGKLTVVDLTAMPERVIDTVSVEAGSEGFAISPRGNIAVSVALRGSNGSVRSPMYHRNGAIVVLRIDGAKLTPIDTIDVGRVPEAVGFTPDGRYLYVGNYYDDDFWIFRVEGEQVVDTGKKFSLPGHPASARISMK